MKIKCEFERTIRVGGWQKKIVATNPDKPDPMNYLGAIWITPSRYRVRIDHVFTADTHRRHGVAATLLKTVEAYYPGRRITTNAATKHGRAWLEAQGFKWSEQHHEYEKLNESK